MRARLLGILRSRWIRRGAQGLAALLLLATGAGLVYEQLARRAALADFPPPGVLVEAPGGPLHLHCVGQGTPTVVLEAGASQPSVAWWPVQERVAGFTRVCSYDRAGIGWSAAASGNADPEAMAIRLREVLRNADVPPPYVLAGHSIGGPLAMIFGDLFPDDVAGYVFVDSADPDRFEMLDISPPEPPAVARTLAGGVTAFLASVGVTRWQMRGIRKPDHWPQDVFDAAVAFSVQNSVAGTREQVAAPDIVRRASNVGSFGSAPTIVLTARSSLQNPGAPMAPEEWERARLRMQDAIAERSTNGVRRIVDDVGHNVHLDDPVATSQAIREVVHAVREGSELAND